MSVIYPYNMKKGNFILTTRRGREKGVKEDKEDEDEKEDKRRRRRKRS